MISGKDMCDMTPLLRHTLPHNQTAENRYCSKCRMTTKHGIDGSTYTCERCGSVADKMAGPLWRKAPVKPPFEEKIRIALGLVESTDKPVRVKLEGESKTSAEGAHRPDKGVKFVQMKYDDQFKTKENDRSLRS